MALTYEDMNCTAAGMYDSTAYAMLHGIGDYLGLEVPVVALEESPILPDRITLLQNYPNPFNASTTLRYDLPNSGRINLAVYNLAGQEVVHLAGGWRPAGTHQGVWNGRNSRGVEVASGVYFARLEMELGVYTHKLLLLK